MSTLQQILLVIAGALAVWQIPLLIAWARMVSNPKYTNVRVGIGPGLLAVILVIVVILL